MAFFISAMISELELTDNKIRTMPGGGVKRTFAFNGILHLFFVGSFSLAL